MCIGAITNQNNWDHPACFSFLVFGIWYSLWFVDCPAPLENVHWRNHQPKQSGPSCSILWIDLWPRLNMWASCSEVIIVTIIAITNQNNRDHPACFSFESQNWMYQSFDSCMRWSGDPITTEIQIATLVGPSNETPSLLYQHNITILHVDCIFSVSCQRWANNLVFE